MSNYPGYQYPQNLNQPQHSSFAGQAAPVHPEVQQQQQNPARVPMPSFYQPDEGYTKSEYERVRAEAAQWGSGGALPFLKFLGPQGQAKWDESVPVNYEAKVLVFICPPWQQGRTIFRQVKTHFWKSQAAPQGTSIGCPGPERCLICQSKEMVLNAGASELKERAKSFGRVRKQFLYNVIMLENLNGHFDPESNMWRPFILGAGARLHNAIGDLVVEHGALNIVNPNNGRPIRLKKRKTGKSQMDVDYGAANLDSFVLPQQFWMILHNLHDLDKQERVPTHEEMGNALNDMGLPMPGTQSAASYQSSPSPAYPNPYTTAPNPVGAAESPTYMPPPADPLEFPPGSSGADPAYQSMVGPTPPAMNPATTPPAMSPPPVQSQPPAQPQQMPVEPQPAYNPQPGSMTPPPPPPVTAPPVGQTQAVAPAGPQTLSYPLPQGAMLPGGRERCFGKFTQGDRLCEECPHWVKQQCVPIVGVQTQQQQGNQQGLAQLQSKAAGQ